jgi:hypothetical protein
MMEASEIRGIVPCTLVKREMNARRVSPEVFNEAEPCNISTKALAKTKTQMQHVEKDRIDGLRHSTTTKSPRQVA